MLKVLLFFLLIYNISYAGIWDNFYKKAKNYSGIEIHFVQISKIEGFEEENIYTGKAVVSKEGKIKIVYTKPELQEILIDKNKSWLYIPSENKLIVSKVDEDLVIISIFNLISGKDEIEKFFKKVEDKSSVILYPKENFLKDIDKVKISFKKGKPSNITILDKEGNITVIKIKKLKYLDKLPNLHINYPENVEIIEY